MVIILDISSEHAVRTYGVNQIFRFFEGNWLHRKSRQIRHYFSRKRPFLRCLCAACSDLPSYISTMNYTWAQTCSFKHLNTMLANGNTCFICYLSFHSSPVCPRSSDTFCIVINYIKWVTTSWTYSMFQGRGH